ncbi:phenolic acid decarboxylase [Nocardia sp. SYP-A9097]|uniref:phenolic acid decarboxylase n=1 Tax=Nocardia sp. SYP-A9097 TaxID=2663237 RepID=UPI00129A32CF|nr:phenolic acid decarboxylase [Nocardia sp. SYP-A9097]MRH90731.1 phenolic acid decarboxylase [Nocardia sp. SYP-A9097]
MSVDRSAAASPPAPPGDLTGLVGKHLIYAYENGWKYELYVRDSTTVAFRCLIGPMFGRWSTHQTAKIVHLQSDMYKLAWVEPTGTSTVVIAWLSERRVHTTICYPQWMLDFPEYTLGRYEDHLGEILAARDAGPTYPLTLVASTGAITFLESRPPDDDTVIDRPPRKLSVDYANRAN